MTRTTLIDAGGYRLTAIVKPLTTPAKHVRVLLQSTLAHAKDPHDAVRVADLILSDDAALRFAALLAEEVSQ